MLFSYDRRFGRLLANNGKKKHKQNNKIKTTQKSTEKQKQQLSNIWNVLSFNLALVAKLRLHAKGEMR